MAEPLCPSATGEAQDATVIGFVGANGEVDPVVPPIPFTEAMRQSVGAHPERAFRFSARCVEGACRNWAGARCGLIGRLQDELGAASIGMTRELPHCGIRATCVWWRQSGPEACKVCRYVTYNPSS